MTRILIIEPDMVLARLYQTALETSGHEVSRVSNAQEALFAIEKSRPDTVILEIDMPNHNGLEFLYEFSSYSDWATINIIVHSALRPSLFDRMKVSWQHLGVSEYLYKPETSLAALQQVVA
ncbi:MAG: response regulator [Patescibacteria group bacterium]